MIPAGKLDRRVVILALVSGQDDFGGTIETWTPLATVWAQWLGGAGAEKFTAASVYAEAEGRFRLRWRADITTTHRVSFDGKSWDILAVNEIGRRAGVELKVKARA